MAARKHLLGRRRSEGDDDESAMVGDSQSEGSLGSVAGDGEVSTVADAPQGNGTAAPEMPESDQVISSNGVNKIARLTRKSLDESEKPTFKPSADTEGMMHGLFIDDAPDEVFDFEDVGDSVSVAAEKRAQPVQAPSSNIRIDRPIDRQRREHEEYRRKRDADPAFIPNRGNFFMHDTRGSPTTRGPAPERGGFAGRGRGRGFGGPAVTGYQAPREQPWKHDLHEVINEEPPTVVGQAASLTRDQEESARIFPKTNNVLQRPSVAPTAPQVTAITLGNVAVHVCLPGMSKAITLEEPLTMKRHMRFPDHRPPLRRDKPVRVYLHGYGPKYIFPSADRSFVFIPRQLRPNQRGYGSNTYQRGSIGYNPHSRRTSVFGGSMYSASVAASRRSSIAGRDGAFSPASFNSGFPGQQRPFVNLPPGGRMYSNGTSPAAPLSGYHTPTAQVMHTYPLPQKPMMTGTPTVALHQPRPQKTISVTGIESPAALQQARRPSSSSSQQPFHGQLPAHMTEQPVYAQQQGQYYASGPTYDFAGQLPASGTPLLGIPEQTMHGQTYQPPNMYYPQYPPPQQPYYYPQQAPMQMYMPPAGPAQPYIMQPPVQQQAPLAQTADPQQAPSGMVAHESNGMVFYMPAAEVAQQPSAPSATEYQPAESFVPAYAMPGLPPPTPGPEESGYYYPPVEAGGQGWGYGSAQ